MNIKDLVKNNKVVFQKFRQGVFYYKLFVIDEETRTDTSVAYTGYEFPVPIEDIGTATLLVEDKAITYMRWIRKAIEDETLIELK